ncbi:hypothetical protein Z043_109848 [Scleropages formosus]|uniref:Uncharacterized protein n=1 Tax=Scleropages formosus TaxID=113540 RepID=A0A0P7UQ43_SCLFO|nr:hypothetical protein Z043_109848 [Scleropages formosus]
MLPESLAGGGGGSGDVRLEEELVLFSHSKKDTDNKKMKGFAKLEEVPQLNSACAYPIYQMGNPQLRVFRPNFSMTLVRPGKEQPPDTVQFRISMDGRARAPNRNAGFRCRIPVGKGRQETPYVSSVHKHLALVGTPPSVISADASTGAAILHNPLSERVKQPSRAPPSSRPLPVAVESQPQRHVKACSSPSWLLLGPNLTPQFCWVENETRHAFLLKAP